MATIASILNNSGDDNNKNDDENKKGKVKVTPREGGGKVSRRTVRMNKNKTYQNSPHDLPAGKMGTKMTMTMTMTMKNHPKNDNDNEESSKKSATMGRVKLSCSWVCGKYNRRRIFKVIFISGRHDRWLAPLSVYLRGEERRIER